MEVWGLDVDEVVDEVDVIVVEGVSCGVVDAVVRGIMEAVVDVVVETIVKFFLSLCGVPPSISIPNSGSRCWLYFLLVSLTSIPNSGSSCSA